MKIGELARRAGSTSETVRYYERIGLLPRAGRNGSNYRDYGERDVERLAFVRHARGLGFEIEDIRSLLSLSEMVEQNCHEVDAIAARQLGAVERKIAQLERLRDELGLMTAQCRGDRISTCRVIEALNHHTACGLGHHSDQSRRI